MGAFSDRPTSLDAGFGSRYAKRCPDLLGVSMMMLAGLPLTVVLAVAVKLDYLYMTN